MNFPHNEQLVMPFYEIDDLATIAELSQAPVTKQHTINMGHLFIQQAKVYFMALNCWNQRENQE